MQRVQLDRNWLSLLACLFSILLALCSVIFIWETVEFRGQNHYLFQAKLWWVKTLCPAACQCLLKFFYMQISICLIVGLYHMDEIWPAGLCFAVSFGGENTSFLFGSQKFIIFMGEVTEMEAIWFHDPSSLASLAYIYLKKQSNVWKFKFNSADLCSCLMIMSKMISDPEWSLKNTMLREERSF